VEQQKILNESSKIKKFETFSKDQLIERVSFLEDECARIIRENYKLRNHEVGDSQIVLLLEEQLRATSAELYGASSEKYINPNKKEKPKDREKESSKPRKKRPSERYPNVPVREIIISLDPLPSCTSCGFEMSDSGMREESEQLTVIPKKFEILVQRRVKYRCQCHGCIKTAPLPARIIEGSSYSDEMILDVALSKYCDLIPMHRYTMMASRLGVSGLPAHSLIDVTHGLSDFLFSAYELLEKDLMESRVLHADETPHKMLEGSETKNWYLWGFSTPRVCFFECHDTRSGDIASDILKNSKCEVIVSDVYSGYGKAIRISNLSRQKLGLPVIKNGNCNAHARRYFYKTWSSIFKESEYYLEKYQEIYELNEKSKGQAPPEILEIREQMRPFFEEMRDKALGELLSFSEKSQYGKALRYFIKNYEGLTLFLDNADVLIDNNSQERLLRSHVVGRKTWYGTHSERGAETAAVLFSLVETCKLNKVNPREYFSKLTANLLDKKPPFAPWEFKNSSPTG
jgi:transposase